MQGEKNEILKICALSFQDDKKLFVVKAIPVEMDPDENLEEVTNKEVDILKKMKHPNVVR